MSTFFSVKDASAYTSGDIIIPSSAIQHRIGEMAKMIAGDYQKKDIVVIGLLKGACLVTSELVQRLYKLGLRQLMLDFLTVRSYAAGTTATTAPRVVNDTSLDLKNRHVLVVDDIIDTGKSLAFVKEHLQKKGATHVAFFTLLDKPTRRKVDFKPEYVGFTIPDIWVQGYGMDTDEIGRGSPDIIKGPYGYEA